MVIAEPMTETETRGVDEIVWREDLYPRFEPNPQTIQRYAQSIEYLPPIEINQHNELIDGYHRWTAHKTAGVETVPVRVTVTASDAEFLRLAIERNAKHGIQLTMEEKKSLALKLYPGAVESPDDLAKLLAVSESKVYEWLQNKLRAEKEERQRLIRDLWMQCWTQQEIAGAVGLSRPQVTELVQELSAFPGMEKPTILAAKYEDPDWSPQLYSVWNFAKNANDVEHYGNTHVGIVDNLLYLYTQPFDIVIDPFGGGGSTIDICKRRSRRYWVSDRVPVAARRDIRSHDVVTDGVSGPSRWGDVALVYLDPPYWKQAAGKYSQSENDLANMPLGRFTDTLVELIHSYATKMRAGSHIACIISPTQWPNENHENVYHDLDLACRVQKKTKLVQRIVCPYSSQQYNGTQVEIAKRDKLVMAIDRTMLVWQVV